MDTDTYETTVDLTLKPLWHDEPPLVCIKCFDQEVQTYLTEAYTFSFRKDASPGEMFISVEFLNKKDSDTVVDQDLDKAIIIEAIKINGIQDDRFIWRGKYRPEYPEPWYSQQVVKPADILTDKNYLGWNGEWKLDITVPAFVWMHQVLDLGWIYD